MTSTATAHTTPIIAIRQATADDAADLRRLAALDSAPMPMGTVLVGVVDGEIVAATALTGGRVVADPFRPTSEVVALLQVRAARVRGDAEAHAAPQVALTAARRLRRATALRI